MRLIVLLLLPLSLGCPSSFPAYTPVTTETKTPSTHPSTTPTTTSSTTPTATSTTMPTQTSETGDTATLPTTTTPTPPPDAPFSLEHRPIVCSDPGARDVARFDLQASRAEAPKRAWFWGGGAAAADFNGDGYVDLVLPGFWETMFYVGKEDGTLDDASALLSGFDLHSASGASVADFDGDGDLDLLVTRFQQPDRLLRNEGKGFVDISVEAGISDVSARSVASSWADYDRDGDLDLFVGCYGFLDESGVPHETFEPGEPSSLYRNEGDGTFADVSATLPSEVHDGYTLGGGWFDFDTDGLPELYVVNDFGVAFPNRLLWNRGGGLLELDGGLSGLDVAITGMGLGFGFLNDDDIPDIVMPEWENILLLQSGPYDTWFDWAEALGVVRDEARDQKIPWAGEMVDIDNDGDLDIPMSFGHLESTYPSPEEQPDALYLQSAGRFEDVAPEWGLDDRIVGRGALPVDFNDDGWLDLLKRDLAGPSLLYRSRCGEQGWLRVKLRQDGLNVHAVGARVVVFAGSERWERRVAAGGTGFSSGGPPEVHFGFGDLDALDRIEVTWPDGHRSVADDVATRQVLTVNRL
jgi:enediyne biosynthesis protein E4